MKQRLVVMNGQRVIQTVALENETFDSASNEVLGKANGIKPGVYNLYLAQPPKSGIEHSGMVIHKDKNVIYQKTKAGIVAYELSLFDQIHSSGRKFLFSLIL